jgi:prevent-host-death family protein
MAVVTIHEAKTKLSELIRRVEAGETIIIARGDKQVAVLTDLKNHKPDDVAARRLAGMGSEAGKYPPTPDSVFFGPMPDDEFIEMFGQDFYDLHKNLRKDGT